MSLLSTYLMQSLQLLRTGRKSDRGSRTRHVELLQKKRGVPGSSKQSPKSVTDWADAVLIGSTR